MERNLKFVCFSRNLPCFGHALQPRLPSCLQESPAGPSCWVSSITACKTDLTSRSVALEQISESRRVHDILGIFVHCVGWLLYVISSKTTEQNVNAKPLYIFTTMNFISENGMSSMEPRTCSSMIWIQWQALRKSCNRCRKLRCKSDTSSNKFQK